MGVVRSHLHDTSKVPTGHLVQGCDLPIERDLGGFLLCLVHFFDTSNDIGSHLVRQGDANRLVACEHRCDSWHLTLCLDLLAGFDPRDIGWALEDG